MFAKTLRRSDTSDSTGAELYRAIVAQARRPALYAQFDVPDTVEGRFEMVVLHSVLLFHRLRRDDQAGQLVSQKVFDVFVTDMDRSLREMGVGDLSIPKRMKAMGRSFFGRLEAYGKPLADADNNALIEALQRNLFPDEPPSPAKTSQLAAYVLRVATDLHRQSFAAMKKGRLGFPEPDRNGESKVVA